MVVVAVVRDGKNVIVTLQVALIPQVSLRGETRAFRTSKRLELDEPHASSWPRHWAAVGPRGRKGGRVAYPDPSAGLREPCGRGEASSSPKIRETNLSSRQVKS